MTKKILGLLIAILMLTQPLYAIAQAKGGIQVMYHLGDEGRDITDSQKYDNGDTVNLIANPSILGSTFLGWSDAPKGSVIYPATQRSFVINQPGNGTIQLYAVWNTVTSPEATPTPTPVVTPTPTPEATPTPTPEATPTPTPEATPEPSPEVTPTPTPEATPEPSPEVTPTPSPEATPEPSPEVTPAPSPEVTPEPSPEVTPTPIPEATPTPTPEATPVPTPVVTPAPTTEATSVPTTEATPTQTAPLVTPVPTVAPIAIVTPVATATPVPTASPSPVLTTIPEESTPLGPSPDAGLTEIPDEAVPLNAQPESTDVLTLVNLITMVLTVIGAALLLFKKSKKDEQTGNKEESGFKHTGTKVISLIAAVGGVALFFLTQPLTGLDIWDKYSIWQIVVLAVGVVMAIVAYTKKKVQDKAENTDA